MSKFQFRLQRVLDYREMAEQWAKDAYLDARAAKIEADGVLHQILERRRHTLTTPTFTLAEHQALERVLNAVDDEERQQRIVIEMLAEDEERFRADWIERQRDLQTLVMLRETALAEWEHEENRREQASLDEWAVQRHAA